MAQTKAAFGPFDTATFALSRRLRALLRNVRFVVVLSVVLICGSFICAGAIQMRMDREHALAQSAAFTARRADALASDLDAQLDSYAAIGAAFANARAGAETSAALAEAGGQAMLNVAVLGNAGNLVAEMKSAPHGFLPLAPGVLQRARTGRTVVPSTDGRSVALLFPTSGRIVAVQIDAASLFPSASTADALLTTPSGYLLALGAAWTSAPNQAALALDGEDTISRIVDTSAGARLYSLRRLSDWPLGVGSSVAVGEALGAWYGALPLYLFFILGPAFAGAGLAVVFVREFERRARTADAERALLATRPEEARLLVRLAEAERRAVDAERAKSQFMAHMSHELRTPLNAIIGFSEVIERGVFGPLGHPKYAEYAKDIGTAGKLLHTKIGDTLEFADLQARRRTIAAESINVSEISRQAIDEIAAKAFQSGVRLTVSLPDEARAQGDAIAVGRILENLLSNAVQYTPKGGTVRVQLREDISAVVVQIRDSGLGFSPEEKARVGESFRRFDRPGSTTGMGLGLTIATTLARRMGATLRIASTQGEGTTAELRLPRATAPTDTSHTPRL